MTALEEIKEAARSIIEKNKDLFLFSTVDGDNRPQSRYMGAMVLDGDFEVLMVTHRDSRKVAQIRKNPNAQLVFATEDYSRVVTLSGTARLGVPVEKKQEVWKKVRGLRHHFDGYTSPEFCVIRFKASALELVTAKIRYEPMRVELQD